MINNILKIRNFFSFFCRTFGEINQASTLALRTTLRETVSATLSILTLNVNCIYYFTSVNQFKKISFSKRLDNDTHWFRINWTLLVVSMKLNKVGYFPNSDLVSCVSFINVALLYMIQKYESNFRCSLLQTRSGSSFWRGPRRDGPDILWSRGQSSDLRILRVEVQHHRRDGRYAARQIQVK